MDDDITKKLREAYVCIEEHVDIWEKLVAKTERPLVALANLSEQLRLVKKADDPKDAVVTLTKQSEEPPLDEKADDPKDAVVSVTKQSEEPPLDEKAEDDVVALTKLSELLSLDEKADDPEDAVVAVTKESEQPPLDEKADDPDDAVVALTKESEQPPLDEKAEEAVVALTKQSEPLCLDEKADDADHAENELLTLPNLKPNLVLKIKSGLEKELSLISDIMEELSQANAVLERRYEAVVKSFEKLKFDCKDRIGSILVGTNSTMVEWVTDVRNCYQGYYMQASQAKELLDYYDEDSVVSFSKSFQEDEAMKKDIKGLLRVTSWFTHPETQ